VRLIIREFCALDRRAVNLKFAHLCLFPPAGVMKGMTHHLDFFANRAATSAALPGFHFHKAPAFRDA